MLTTEKDASRLAACDLGDLPIAAVPLVVGIEPADRFRDWLLGRLASARTAHLARCTSHGALRTCDPAPDIPRQSP